MGSAPLPCSINSVHPGQASAPAAGASGEITLSSGDSCAWTAGTNVSWLAIQPLKGAGPATLTYTVHPNFGTGARTGHFSIAGQAVTVSQPGASASEPERFAGYLHYNAFGRTASAAEVAQYIAAMNGGLSRGQLAADLVSSAEFRSGSRVIAALHIALFNRDPEYLAWISQRASLVSGAAKAEQLAADLLASADFQAVHGPLSDIEFAGLIHRQILRRAATQSELDAMAAELQAGMSRAQLVMRSLESPGFESAAGARLTAFCLYATVLQRRPSPFEAAAMTGQIEAGASLPALAETLRNGPELQNLLR
jgi:hypothetical protein